MRRRYAGFGGAAAQYRDARRWSCARKVRFDTLEQAEITRAKLLKSKGRRLRAYSCAFCGGYHLARVKGYG